MPSQMRLFVHASTFRSPFKFLARSGRPRGGQVAALGAGRALIALHHHQRQQRQYSDTKVSSLLSSPITLSSPPSSLSRLIGQNQTIHKSCSISTWRLNLPKHGKQPEALVVLLGWWGAKQKHMTKYATSIYEEYNDLPCATLVGVADPFDILTKNDASLELHALHGLSEIQRFVLSHQKSTNRQTDPTAVPVIVHSFSNAGGFVLQHMGNILMQNDDKDMIKTQKNERDDDGDDVTPHHHPFIASDGTVEPLCITSIDDENVLQEDFSPPPPSSSLDIALLKKSICGEIFDSGPVYPSWVSCMEAVKDVSFLQNASVFQAIGIGSVLSALYFYESTRRFWSKKDHRLVQYWDDLEHTIDISKDQAYIYSDEDKIMNSKKLEDFMKIRKESMGSNIVSLKMEGTKHVQHFREKPEEYKNFIHHFVDDVVHHAAGTLQSPTPEKVVKRSRVKVVNNVTM